MTFRRGLIALGVLLVASVMPAAPPPAAPAVGQPAAPLHINTDSAKKDPTPDWRTRVRRELAELMPPTAPAGAGNPVDALLDSWRKKQKQLLPPANPCDDRVFLRRASLDLVGLLPDEKQVEAFAADHSPTKRTALVQRLLADRTAYAEHWMTFWNDLLRNDEAAWIEINHPPITAWLFKSLSDNKPYDLFAAELINPGPQGPVGFIQGVDWKFATSASETPPMQAARSVAQVFQGVNLKCASCHNHFTRPWKLDDAWALAGCFSTTPLESQRCDRPTGRIVGPRFLFAGLGEIPADVPVAKRREVVATMVTRPRNPRFAKVIVNRLFKQLFGQGIIDQVDDFDGSPGFMPELLDYLAYDFAMHDYDLKHTLELLATSNAYQMQAVATVRSAVRDDAVKGDAEPPFVGLRVKRMTAEQFSDAVSKLTGSWRRAELAKAEVPNLQPRAWRFRDTDSLAAALGRPSRDVIQSGRPDGASVLQALELINGDVLRDHLTTAAQWMLSGPLGQQADIANVVDTICLRAYCRHATPAEVQQGRELLGTPAAAAADRQAGWEDFLWLVVMRAEFQYIE
ncbi:MAG: DUF1549 and DUF1553 domain-containing protein [Planctomycetia bacterium]|nr:DUF1549 and DUF1553 domain-containing protein [Planctomycetia bacterium]